MLIKDLIDPKILRILTVLVRDKDKHFHINKLANQSKVPVSSTFRILNQLLKQNYIEKITIDKFKIYKLADNRKTAELKKIL